ncbi:hypothetical protein [Streptomyces sp. NPDC002758]
MTVDVCLVMAFPIAGFVASGLAMHHWSLSYNVLPGARIEIVRQRAVVIDGCVAARRFRVRRS